MGRVYIIKDWNREIKTINEEHAFPDWEDPLIGLHSEYKKPTLMYVIVKFQDTSDREDSKYLQEKKGKKTNRAYKSLESDYLYLS